MTAFKPSEAPAGDGAGQLFIAGVPRSGSHVVAHLLGRHSRYFMIPRELHFHCKGVTSFLHGEIDADGLIESLRSFWWKRPAPWNPDHSVGLHKTIAREDFEAGIEAFSALHADDPLAAGRALVRAMLDPLAARGGKPAWIEHTPGNGTATRNLLSMFPNAKFVHIVRDARDRACSVLALPVGVDSVTAAFHTWEWRLVEIDVSLRSVPTDQRLDMQLEDLVLLDRERSYRRLLDFLHLDDEPEMRSFFATEVTAERAHIGRWRSELPAEELPNVEALYRETLTRLRAEGVSCLPPERDLVVSHPARDSDPPNPFDPWANEVDADVM